MEISDTKQAELKSLPAGDFSAWLRQLRGSLLGEGGVDVACGDCTGCCSSSQFIHIKPKDEAALGRIPDDLLFKAPGAPAGHMLMGYDEHGSCPMLKSGKCVIYQHRPQTCRNYDCRIFSATGIAAGGSEKTMINRRVNRWRFTYPTERDRAEHRAVVAVVKFIREHADAFPRGRVPDSPSELAVVAVKAYGVFVVPDQESAGNGGVRSNSELAAAIMDACREFDAMAPA